MHRTTAHDAARKGSFLESSAPVHRWAGTKKIVKLLGELEEFANRSYDATARSDAPNLVGRMQKINELLTIRVGTRPDDSEVCATKRALLEMCQPLLVVQDERLRSYIQTAVKQRTTRSASRTHDTLLRLIKACGGAAAGARSTITAAYGMSAAEAGDASSTAGSVRSTFSSDVRPCRLDFDGAGAAGDELKSVSDAGSAVAVSAGNPFAGKAAAAVADDRKCPAIEEPTAEAAAGVDAAADAEVNATDADAESSAVDATTPLKQGGDASNVVGDSSLEGEEAAESLPASSGAAIPSPPPLPLADPQDDARPSRRGASDGYIFEPRRRMGVLVSGAVSRFEGPRRASAPEPATAEEKEEGSVPSRTIAAAARADGSASAVMTAVCGTVVGTLAPPMKADAPAAAKRGSNDAKEVVVAAAAAAAAADARLAGDEEEDDEDEGSDWETEMGICRGAAAAGRKSLAPPTAAGKPKGPRASTRTVYKAEKALDRAVAKTAELGAAGKPVSALQRAAAAAMANVIDNDAMPQPRASRALHKPPAQVAFAGEGEAAAAAGNSGGDYDNGGSGAASSRRSGMRGAATPSGSKAGGKSKGLSRAALAAQRSISPPRRRATTARSPTRRISGAFSEGVEDKPAEETAAAAEAVAVPGDLAVAGHAAEAAAAAVPQQIPPDSDEEDAVAGGEAAAAGTGANAAVDVHAVVGESAVEEEEGEVGGWLNQDSDAEQEAELAVQEAADTVAAAAAAAHAAPAPAVATRRPATAAPDVQAAAAPVLAVVPAAAAVVGSPAAEIAVAAVVPVQQKHRQGRRVKPLRLVAVTFVMAVVAFAVAVLRCCGGDVGSLQCPAAARRACASDAARFVENSVARLRAVDFETRRATVAKVASNALAAVTSRFSGGGTIDASNGTTKSSGKPAKVGKNKEQQEKQQQLLAAERREAAAAEKREALAAEKRAAVATEKRAALAAAAAAAEKREAEAAEKSKSEAAKIVAAAAAEKAKAEEVAAAAAKKAEAVALAKTTAKLEKMTAVPAKNLQPPVASSAAAAAAATAGNQAIRKTDEATKKALKAEKQPAAKSVPPETSKNERRGATAAVAVKKDAAAAAAAGKAKGERLRFSFWHGRGEASGQSAKDSKQKVDIAGRDKSPQRRPVFKAAAGAMFRFSVTAATATVWLPVVAIWAAAQPPRFVVLGVCSMVTRCQRFIGGEGFPRAAYA